MGAFQEKNRMGKFSKHLGQGSEVEIDGEMFLLKPLTTDQLPLFFKAMKAFSGAGEGGSIEEALKNVDDDGLQAIQQMIDLTLQKSYPEDDEEERKQFGLKYMMDLMTYIFEINTASIGQGEPEKQKALQEVKKKMEVKHASKNPQTN